MELINASPLLPVELTFNYGWTFDDGDDQTLLDDYPCFCGNDNCSGTIYKKNNKDNSEASDISLHSQDTI